MSSWQHHPSSFFDESLKAAWYGGEAAHSLHIYFQLIYSHYAAPQTPTRGFLPRSEIHSDIPGYTRGGREDGGESRQEETRRKRSDGGGAFSHAPPVNSDTFDRGTLCFQALCWRHQLILAPLAQSPLEISLLLSHNEARPPVWLGVVSWLHVLVLLMCCN